MGAKSEKSLFTTPVASHEDGSFESSVQSHSLCGVKGRPDGGGGTRICESTGAG